MENIYYRFIDNLYITQKLKEEENSPGRYRQQSQNIDYLDKMKYVISGLSHEDPVYETLIYNYKVTLTDFSPQEITTAPWVGDIDHKVLHKSMDEVFDYLMHQKDYDNSSESLKRVISMCINDEILELYPVVIIPGGILRDRLSQPHYLTPANYELCPLNDYKEGRGCIAKGNHRALAQLMAGKESITAFAVYFGTIDFDCAITAK